MFLSPTWLTIWSDIMFPRRRCRRCHHVSTARHMWIVCSSTMCASRRIGYHLRRRVISGLKSTRWSHTIRAHDVAMGSDKLFQYYFFRSLVRPFGAVCLLIFILFARLLRRLPGVNKPSTILISGRDSIVRHYMVQIANENKLFFISFALLCLGDAISSFGLRSGDRCDDTGQQIVQALRHTQQHNHGSHRRAPSTISNWFASAFHWWLQMHFPIRMHKWFRSGWNKLLAQQMENERWTEIKDQTQSIKCLTGAHLMYGPINHTMIIVCAIKRINRSGKIRNRKTKEKYAMANNSIFRSCERATSTSHHRQHTSPLHFMIIIISFFLVHDALVSQSGSNGAAYCAVVVPHRPNWCQKKKKKKKTSSAEASSERGTEWILFLRFVWFDKHLY